MTIFTHEVTITFEDGSKKIIHTYCPNSWDTLEKVKQSPVANRRPKAVHVRERTAKEIAGDFAEDLDI